MEEKNKKKSEIVSFVDLLSVFFKYKVLIIVTTLFAVIGIVIFCVVSIKLPINKSPLPNLYTSTADILISEDNNNGVSSILNSSGLGSLASLMGPSGANNSSNKELAKFIINSNFVIDGINEKFNFTGKFNITEYPLFNTRNEIRNRISTKTNESNGIFSLSFTYVDPIIARDVVSYMVELLSERFIDFNIDKNKLALKNISSTINKTLDVIDSLQNKINNLEDSVSNVYNSYSAPSIVQDIAMVRLELDAQKEIYKQLKAQEELLKVEISSEKPVFQILEYPEIPELKSGPNRGALCVIVSICAFLGSLLLVLLVNYAQTIKKNR